MKQLSILLAAILLLYSCQNEAKKPEQNRKKPSETLQTEKWILNEDALSIHWTGYKTTGKIPVKGVFQNFNIKGVKPAGNLKTTIENAIAEINIYSIFSDNESRDKKLITKLFENMTATEKIYARIEQIDKDGQTAMMSIKMNGRKKTLPVKLQIDEDNGKVTLNGKLDLLEDFDANKAFEQFHQVCYDKHTGKDGVSKTWTEVGFRAELVFDRK